MQSGFEKPSVKQHLAAISMLFDWLVTGRSARMVVPPRGVLTDAPRRSRANRSVGPD